MATRAKSRRKTAGKSKGRGRSSSAATKRSAKRATSRTRSGAAKRAGTKRATTKRATTKRTATKRATTKVRAAPKRGATTKRRGAAGGRAGMRRGMSQRSRSALAKAARMMSQQVSEQKVPGDAIALLEQDHREVEALYEQFEQAESSSEKSELAWKICLALTVHAEIEEEIFYPRARRNIDETELLDEAEVEHASAKQLIAEIEEMTPRDKLFDAKVKVLVEYVKHHVKEEETELFPKVRESGMDLHEMGRMLTERKLELLSALSGRA